MSIRSCRVATFFTTKPKGSASDGETPEEAIVNGLDAVRSYRLSCKKHGDPNAETQFTQFTEADNFGITVSDDFAAVVNYIRKR